MNDEIIFERDSEDIEESSLITVQFIPNECRVWIAQENSTGAEYDCSTKEDLKKAFSKYVDEEFFM